MRRGKNEIAGLRPGLVTMLNRFGLASSDVDDETVIALAEHKAAVCVSKPRCNACPLVSFCKLGKERVKSGRAPVVVDLFGGAGGMGSGFTKAGYRIGLAVEYNRDAAQTYRRNNPGVHVLEADVTSLTAANVSRLVGGRPAVICAGPPCQSYSIAGNRKSRDPRHNLFRHVLKLARGLKPDVVLIENVTGINVDVGRRNFRSIIQAELGAQFSAEVHLLRALDYGVPQARRRYFFMGRLKRRAEIGAPAPTHKEKGTIGKLPDAPTVMQALFGMPRRPNGSTQDWSRMGDGSLITNMGTMLHSPKVVLKISKIRGTEGFLSYRRVSRKYANTIVAGHRALPVHPTLDRTMSVREAASIQGFGRSYTFLGTRANQPLQVANAVPPAVAHALALQIKKHIRTHG